MKEGQSLWTKNELILAVNLYCKLPFGKMHKGNADIIELSQLIPRSPSAIARKLGNFASFDPSLKARGIKGLPNTSKLDEEVWNEFFNNWDAALIASEELLAQQKNTTIEKLNNIDLTDIPKEGKEKIRLVKTRVNQSVFRTVVLATYNNTCCITGINNPQLLIASHIAPWSQDEKNRLNPMNGLCLNALHDKAFDCGLITISSEDYTIKISSKLKTKNAPASIEQSFLKLEGTSIHLPGKFLPSKELLQTHNNYFQP